MEMARETPKFKKIGAIKIILQLRIKLVEIIGFPNLLILSSLAEKMD